MMMEAFTVKTVRAIVVQLSNALVLSPDRLESALRVTEWMSHNYLFLACTMLRVTDLVRLIDWLVQQITERQLGPSVDSLSLGGVSCWWGVGYNTRPAPYLTQYDTLSETGQAH